MINLILYLSGTAILTCIILKVMLYLFPDDSSSCCKRGGKKKCQK
jgi:hypothetical protein